MAGRIRTCHLLLAPSVAVVIALVGCGQPETPSTPATAAADTGASGVPSTEDAAASDAPEPTAPDIDPCALVSKEEAEQLAGTALLEPQPSRTACQYPGPTDGPVAQVEVYVGAGAKKMLDIDRELGHDLRPREGIGDEAYLKDFHVYFKQGGVWVAIRLVRLEDPRDYDQALEDRARIAAARF